MKLGPAKQFLISYSSASSLISLPEVDLPSITLTIAGILVVLVATVGEHTKRATGTGKLLADLGQQVDGALTVAGPETSTLLIQLSPEVTALVSGLGLPPVGTLVGSVVASASSVGALVTELGPGVDGLLIVVENGAEYLLVQLSPVVAGLLSGLGLPALGVPLGVVVDEVAYHL